MGYVGWSSVANQVNTTTGAALDVNGQVTASLPIGAGVGGEGTTNLILAPSLNLNFALFNQNTLDPRITFSRTTNATVTNSAGLIAYAPMNLLTFSEQFDNAVWGKGNATVSANVTVAPNGTTTADKLVEDTANANHFTIQTATVIAGATSTFSCYVKSAERTACYVQLDDGTATNQIRVSFNLATGEASAVGLIGAATNGVATITVVGNGWYRVTVSGTPSSVATSSRARIQTQAVFGVNSYTGDGTSGIFIWGAQLEIGSTATTYNSTTVQNLLGFTQEFDNAAWTKSNSFVQTNLVLRSEEFENASWSTSALTISANDIVSPDGYQNAEALIETTAASAFHFSQQTITKAASAIQYTFSIYVKAKGRQLGISVASGAGGAVCRFNPETGLFTLPAAAYGTWTAQSTTATLVGNGWYRVVLVGTSDTATSVTVQVSTYNTALATNVYTGDGVSGFYLWGAQVVQGAVAGDYVRTSSTVMPVMYQAPTGTLSADKLVENTATGAHFLVQNVTNVTGTIYTFSCYAKAGERNFAALQLGGAGFGNQGVYVNLTTGVATGYNGATSFSSTDAGNGWWRIRVSAAAIGTAGAPLILLNNTGGNQNYAGDGTSGIYVWGAQLSDSASLDPYVYNPVAAPTAAAYYGPRFDYDPVTLQPKGLLIEEQRSNLLLNSSLAGTNLATQSVTVTAVAHTLSFYGTGTVTLSGTAIAVVVGTGAYPTRTTLTFTPTVGVVVFTVTGTVQFAQLEIGSFATSFIPTAASQVTRAADTAIIQGSNFSSWYNQNEGTMYVSYDASPTSGSDKRLVLITDSSGVGVNSQLFFISNATQKAGSANTFVNGSNIGRIDASPTFVADTLIKTAYAYATGNRGITASGTATSTSSASYNVVILDRAFIAGTDFINGHIKSFSYYPTRLSNSTLQSLTS